MDFSFVGSLYFPTWAFPLSDDAAFTIIEIIYSENTVDTFPTIELILEMFSFNLTVGELGYILSELDFYLNAAPCCNGQQH